MPTFCTECDNVHEESRKRVPSQWLCSKFPRLDGHGFVDPLKWSEMEPFMKCRDINGGACPVFTKRRDGQLELNTKGK